MLRYRLRLNLFTLLSGLSIGLFGAQNAHALTWNTSPEIFTLSSVEMDFDFDASINGNAFITWIDNESLFVSQFSNFTQNFGSPVLIKTGTDTRNVSVATDATGKALLTWVDSSSNTVFSSYYNGTTWVTHSSSPLDMIAQDCLAQTKVVMDGLGNGLGIWRNSSGSIFVSFFDPGISSWGAFQAITPYGTFGQDPSIDFSSNGTALAIWQDLTGNIIASNFNGLAWSLIPSKIGTTIAKPKVQIDAKGNALAIWLDKETKSIFSKFYNGKIWETPKNISEGQTPVSFDFAMAPTGYAITVWSDGAIGSYSEFIEGNWTSPVIFSTDAKNARVALDSYGNALVGFNTASDSNAAYSIFKPHNYPFETQDIVGTDSNLPTIAFAALSNNGRGFFSGQIGNTQSFGVSRTDTLINQLSPVISGTVCTNKFASQSNKIHIITWTPSSDPSVTAYELYRNKKRIATISASGPFIYYDHNRYKTDTYKLIPVTPFGKGLPVTIKLR